MWLDKYLHWYLWVLVCSMDSVRLEVGDSDSTLYATVIINNDYML